LVVTNYQDIETKAYLLTKNHGLTDKQTWFIAKGIERFHQSLIKQGNWVNANNGHNISEYVPELEVFEDSEEHGKETTQYNVREQNVYIDVEGGFHLVAIILTSH